jgi:hypothetical protein
MSLPVVGVTAAAGAFGRWRAGQLRVAPALLFAATAMVASFTAARLGHDIPDRPRLLVFIAILLVAAALMWNRSRRRALLTVEPVVEPVPKGLALPTLLPAAVVVGVLTGLVGVGGGFLIVPALVGVLALPMPQATATSLAVIALNTLAAGAGWWGRVQLDWQLTAAVTAVALMGMTIGTRLAPRFTARTLTRAFAVLLVVVSGVMMVMEMI